MRIFVWQLCLVVFLLVAVGNHSALLAQDKGISLPKKHTAIQLFQHKNAEENGSSTFLYTIKGSDHVLWEFKNRKLKKTLTVSTPILALHQNSVWTQDNDALRVFSLTDGSLQMTKVLPPSFGNVAALTVGDNDRLFISSTTTQQLYVSTDKGWENLTHLEKAQTLLYDQGQLFIGTDENLRHFQLDSERLKLLTFNLKNVQTLLKDHNGQVVVLTVDDGKILLINEKGEKRQLPIQATAISSICLDSNHLIAINTQNQKLMRIDYLKLIGERK